MENTVEKSLPCGLDRPISSSGVKVYQWLGRLNQRAMILELGAQQRTEKVAAIPDHPSLLLHGVMSSVEASRSSFLKDSVEIGISQPLSASLTLASLPFSESLHAKTGLVPSYQHSQIICCHK